MEIILKPTHTIQWAGATLMGWIIIEHTRFHTIKLK